MKFQGTVIDVKKQKAEEAKRKAELMLYYGEVDQCTPVMFNPTQEDLDKLKIKNIKLFGDDPYSRTTTDGDPYTHLSLLFKFNPRELLNDENLPEERYGLYKIAVTEKILVRKLERKSDGKPFYISELMDARGNVMTMWSDDDISKMKKTDLIKAVQEEVDKKSIQNISKRRLTKEQNKLPWAQKKVILDEIKKTVDLSKISQNEEKSLFKFNANTVEFQRQGYIPFFKLLLHMTHFDPNKQLQKDSPFDAKMWKKICNGDVSALNRNYKNEPYFWQEVDGKKVRPKVGFFLYYKQNNNGYFNQEVFSPSYPGNNQVASFSEFSRKFEAVGNLLNILGFPLKTKLPLYEVSNKLFGIDSSNTINEKYAIVKRPFDMSLTSFDPTSTPVVTSTTNTTTSSSNTAVDDDAFSVGEDDDDDMPF